MYLSNDTNGNPILTLWLSNSTQDAFSGRSATEGQYYGYLNGGLYSDWSGNWSSTSETLTYPPNMYGTSYIRAVTLNNGGLYTYGSGTTTTPSTSSASQSSSNVFASFTLDSYGLTQYMVKPTNIPWQRDQSAITTLGTTYSYPNEAIAPSKTNWYSSGVNYSSKTNYTVWQNDYLWLPSLTETGYSDTKLGLWGVSENQRKNYDGSTTTSLGSVGSTSGNASAFSWLRSGYYYNSNSAYTLSPFGTTASTYNFNSSRAVRPALHLNLKKIKESFTYFFDINTNLDGTHWTKEQKYCTYDVYIDGSRAAYQVSDYNANLNIGQKYEIRNIKISTDKIYDGLLKGSLSGTISGFTEVILKLRTATWEDYASDSYSSGSGTETSPYIIKTPRQLGKLAKDSRSSNLSGKYYKLGANIDLSAHIWSGISQTRDFTEYTFAGTLDGDMYTINNIKTSVDYYVPYHGGLFGRTVASATIKNLILKDGNIRGEGDSGAVVGNGQGTYSNIIVEGVEVRSDTDAAGGIAGTVRGTLTTSVCRDSTITGVWYTGGLVSYCGATVTNCSVINTIVGSASKGYGILGTIVEVGTFNSSYGQGTVNAAATKQMYGDSSAWSNWSYSPLLNGGYPVQKTLFAIGGLTGSENVYNYLTGTLKFSVG